MNTGDTGHVSLNGFAQWLMSVADFFLTCSFVLSFEVQLEFIHLFPILAHSVQEQGFVFIKFPSFLNSME